MKFRRGASNSFFIVNLRLVNSWRQTWDVADFLDYLSQCHKTVHIENVVVMLSALLNC